MAFFDDKEQMLEASVRIAKFQSKGKVIEVKDPELAKTLGMSAGKMYCYYKPSFVVDGFENGQLDGVNVEMMQALDGKCRDEYSIDTEKIKSKTESLMTKKMAQKEFETSFSCSREVKFFFNPDIEQLKRKLSGEILTERPILFIYYPAQFMSSTAPVWKSALSNYAEMFDFYYTDS